MTSKALRAFCLALPEAHEQPHGERTSFRVGKRIFATMTAAGDEAMVRVQPVSLALDLIEAKPEIFLGYGKWTSNGGALGVRIALVDDGLFHELLTEAWRRIAPKRAHATYSAMQL